MTGKQGIEDTGEKEMSIGAKRESRERIGVSVDFPHSACHGAVEGETALRHWHAEVSKAAACLESRWTALALRRVDSDLARRLHEQRNLFGDACITGAAEDIEIHGAALCRGYAAAVRRLEAAGAEDDAYALGADPKTGVKVAIGHQKAALDRVRQLHGQDVIWITPDEVAALISNVEAFKFIGAVKRLFPGAEVIRRYGDEGCSDYPDEQEIAG